jgi:hypothetical protein
MGKRGKNNQGTRTHVDRFDAQARRAREETARFMEQARKAQAEATKASSETEIAANPPRPSKGTRRRHNDPATEKFLQELFANQRPHAPTMDIPMIMPEARCADEADGEIIA